MTTILPVGPFITSPLKQESSGVDFLGLRQANLDMMDECLPGINNYIRYIRVFSVVSWIYWKFYEQASMQDIQDPSVEQLKIFKEKAEILFTWGHKRVDPGGIPGIKAAPPMAKGEVELSFDAWNRSPGNTSLVAAPTYGPASKTTGGLGFIEPIRQSFFKARGYGVKLARALDQQLASRPGYSDLISFEIFSGTESLSQSLLDGWDVRTPTEVEREAFRSSFYDPSAMADKSKLGRRSLTVSWIFAVLRAAEKKLTLHEVRQAMAYRYVKGQGVVGTDENTEKAWLAWLILQIRQAQRLGFEALLSWLEERIMFHDQKSIDEILISAMEGITTHSEIFTDPAFANDLLTRFDQSYQCLDDYVSAIIDAPEFCIFNQIELVLKAIAEKDDVLVPAALKMLMTCSCLTGLLKLGNKGLSQLNLGGRDRISLNFWCDIVEKWRARPLNDFLLYIFENFILSQHFGVAASRFDGQKQRLRITLEEEGLTPMVHTRLEPFIGDDRLHMALLLLADSGMIVKMEDGSFFDLVK